MFKETKNSSLDLSKQRIKSHFSQKIPKYCNWGNMHVDFDTSTFY